MIELEGNYEPPVDVPFDYFPASFHATFRPVNAKLVKWFNRFSYSVDKTIANDLALLYLLASRKFLDHREPVHLFRLVLAAHLMQKNLVFSTTLAPEARHVEIKWLPGNLLFPFTESRAVMGCLVGFNLLDRHEVFDEENVVLALKKNLPDVRIVKESSYSHTSPHKHLQLFYFEIEKNDNTPFSLQEKKLLKTHLQEKVKKSIQPLSPTIFMGNNDEDIYKNALVLGQEIHSLEDLPQVSITLDQQTGKDIIFRITIVHVAPLYSFSLGRFFFNSSFVPERMLVVGHLNQHPIEAHIFRLHLPRDSLFLRSDGSLDFYAVRQKVVTLVSAAIGEFRDYNGGILIKQQELLRDLKEEFMHDSSLDHELIDAFFYTITPLEKQITLHQETLFALFHYFQLHRQQKLVEGAYSCHVYESDSLTYLTVRGEDVSMISAITDAIQRLSYVAEDITYNAMELAEGVFFNSVISQENIRKELFIEAIQDACQKWQQKRKESQVLRIALDHSIVSLDPRIGGESASAEVLRLLFEGLTRYDQYGKVENGVAEHIAISADLCEYTFRLRPALWNDGSPVSAYDFEYAWKKILSPDFKTSFAHLFYPIMNAKEAKEGKVSLNDIGIDVVDQRTLKVILHKPTPCFLQMTASTIYAPVHRLIDQEHPHWSYECGTRYPCNGPFQLKMNQPNQGFQLIKNPFYWDLNQITLEQVTMTVMHPAQAVQAFQRDEVDWLGNPFGSWHSFYDLDHDFKGAASLFFPDCWTSWCVFNADSVPFHQVKLRQAIGYAIQRAEIINTVDRSLTPAYSILLPHYHRTEQRFFPEHQPEMARQLFDEALEAMGLRKEAFPTLHIICHEKGVLERTARCIKQQLKEVLGIDCVLRLYPWNTMFHKLTNKDFHMCLMSWTSCIDDPLDTMNTFRSATQKLNFTGWENAEYQRLLDLSEQQVNPFQRSSSQRRAEEILSWEMPVVPLFCQPNRAIVREGLQIVWRKPSGPLDISKSFYKGL